jgi:Uma2 family endonuclease
MGNTAGPRQRLSGGRLRLSYVPWQMYSRLLRAFEDGPRVKLTYDRGDLEILSPPLDLDDGPFLGHMVWVLTDEFGLPIHAGGSVTLCRRLDRKGLEPDECFWIAHAPQLAGVRRLDLRIHPPPDLAIEIDARSSSLNRMRIYAELGVPEVWRFDERVLTFQVLDADANYQQVEASPTFAGVTPADLMPFLREAHEAADQNPVTRRFREWVRQRKPA